MRHIEDMTLQEVAAVIENSNRQEAKKYEDKFITCPAKVIVYICPTEGCGNYYAASDFVPSNPSLYRKQTRRAEKGGNELTYNRLQCPTCRSKGREVDRVPYLVTQVVAFDKLT